MDPAQYFRDFKWIQLNILVVLGGSSSIFGWIQLNIFGDPADPAQEITPKHPPNGPFSGIGDPAEKSPTRLGLRPLGHSLVRLV